MGCWKRQLSLDSDGHLPVSIRIARAITAQIRAGALRPGDPLPGSRTLAKELGVSRNTVYAAYEELKAEDWLVGARARGTRVNPTLPGAVRERVPEVAGARWTRVGFEVQPLAPSAALERKSSAGPVQLWDFGVPDVRLAPSAALARALRRVLRREADEVLAYDRYGTRDASPLASSLSVMLSATRGLPVGPSNLLVTRGSQMALYLASRALLRPGDVVAVENPGYFTAWETFRRLGARVVPVPVDAQGLQVEALEHLSRRQRVRAVLVTPHHQFPTTVTLSASRRMRLLAWARRHRAILFEDDYDHEFHYEGRPVLPLASSDEWGVVIYVGSFSKVFAPGLRLGYLVAPEPVLSLARAERALVDGQGDRLLEHAFHEMLEDGELQRHLNRSRRLYQKRRDVLLEALERHLGSLVQIQAPAGGLALWAKVDERVDLAQWLKNARARGLSFRTGGIFFFEDRSQPFIRLGFARWTAEELQRGVELLTSALPARPARRQAATNWRSTSRR